MKGALSRAAALMREAVLTAKSQPAGSIVSIIMIAGMCAAVLLTTGRTVGAEQSVLGSIDSAGTRSIVVRAEPDAGLTSDVLDRIGNIKGIEWAGGFGTITDVQNTAIPGGTKVPLRLAWGHSLGPLGIASVAPTGDSVYASTDALTQLGFESPAGGVANATAAYSVVGTASVPSYLGFLEPVLLAPQLDSEPGAMSVLVVVAETPNLVAPVSEAILSVLAVDDSSKITLETSESLATLRALIEGQLGEFGRSLTLVIFGITAALTAAILYGLVLLRRKDFGRRRALGASQRLIAILLLTQMSILSTIGAGIGCATALIILTASGDPLPGADYTWGVAILATFVGTAAALTPALAAARRDPLTELRVP